MSIRLSGAFLPRLSLEAHCANAFPFPRPWLGAYHGAELPLVTGTYGNFGGDGTAFERSVSEKIQDLWLAFARDPHHGLQKLGWSAASGGFGNVNGNAVVLARDEKVVQMEDISVIDANCPAT